MKNWDAEPRQEAIRSFTCVRLSLDELTVCGVVEKLGWGLGSS